MIRKKKVLIFILIPVVIIVGLFLLNKERQKDIDPPVLATNFVDLKYIDKISKFRSCQGHTVAPQDGSESKRNMKHYYWVKPEYSGKEIPIYAPYDGRITTVMSDPDNGLEGEIWLSGDSDWQFSVQHLYPAEGIKRFKKVKSGDLLGVVKVEQSFDIVYAVGANFPKKVDGWNSPYKALDSVFNHMSAQAFALYEAKGATKEKLIVTKEARDQDPCGYITGEGIQAAQLNGGRDNDDWVTLR